MSDRHAGQCWGGADTPDERDREADEAPSDCVLADKGCRDGESACTASYAEGCGAYVKEESHA